jgi:hypothetical protein
MRLESETSGAGNDVPQGQHHSAPRQKSRATSEAPKGRNRSARELASTAISRLPKGHVRSAVQGNGAAKTTLPTDHHETAAPIEDAAIIVMPEGHEDHAARNGTSQAAISLLPEGQQSCAAWLATIQEIGGKARTLANLVAANTFLTNQIKAKCRSVVRGVRCADKEKKCGYELCKADAAEADRLYDAIRGKGQHEREAIGITLAPQLAALEPIEAERAILERNIERVAEGLPVTDWCKSVRGVGMLSLARLVAETGDLSNYSTHSKVWKRLGLAVIDGERQRKCSDKAKAAAHGYNPRRRAVVWVIGDTLFKGQSGRIDKDTGEVKRQAGRYRVVYDTYKARMLDRDGMTPGKAHAMSLRYMTKIFTRDLWREWTRQSASAERPGEICALAAP